MTSPQSARNRDASFLLPDGRRWRGAPDEGLPSPQKAQRLRCDLMRGGRALTPTPLPYGRGVPAPFLHPRAKLRPQACLRALQNTGRRSAARRVESYPLPLSQEAARMVPIRTPRGAPPSASFSLRAALLRSRLLAGPRCRWAPVPLFGSSLPPAIALVRAGFDRIGSIRSSPPLTLSERPLDPIGKPIGAGFRAAASSSELLAQGS